jgi:Cu2+-exporting ATPase
MSAIGLADLGMPRTAAATDRACLHCRSPVPGADERFCCAGCAAAYRLVQELGLARYYEGRELDTTVRPLRPDAATPDIAGYIVSKKDGGKSVRLMLGGVQCPACVWLIESALRKQAGIIEARVNLTTKRLLIRWHGSAEEGARYLGLVQRLGYRAVPYEAERAVDRSANDERRLLRALAVAGFAAANVMLLSISVWAGIDGEMGWATRDLLHWVSALIALPAIAYAAQPFFHSAWAALRHGRTNMDVPISIGVVLVSAFSLYETVTGGIEAYFESATMLIFFLLIGRYLDLRARGKARSAVEQMVRLAAQPASVIDAEGAVHRIQASAVSVGATVLVAAGERIVVDGRIAEGLSAVDKSLLDGETLPLEVGPGTLVHAGTLNLSAPLRISVTATGEGTFLAEIVRLMEIAERGRSRLVALADRVARLYAPAVHSLALLTFIGWSWFVGWEVALLNAVSVLIITCPCALGLAVPAVQVVTSGRLMRRGILLKSATALERLAAVDTVAFDKTGTLTLGHLVLQRSEGDDADLRAAAALAANSRHPLSQALRAACPDTVPLAAVKEHPGDGLSAVVAGGIARLGSRRFCGNETASEDGLPELWLSMTGRAPRRFVFTDTLRPDAAAVVRALKRDGRRVILLSGDRPAVVSALARELGIEWQASLAPQAKYAALRSYAARGEKLLMVGDGLNDAPALAAAYVSMSPASGADVSQAAADVVFQGSSLAAVTDVLAAARGSARIVRENIGFAILYNALAVPLAMAGMITPLIAAVAMSASSIIVVGNALRLYRSKAA